MSVGRRATRIDAAAKLTGAARYPGDLAPPDALHALTVFTDQPHARLLSLDFDAARATPGVVAVFGSCDVPVNEYGLTMNDQPVFIGLQHTDKSEIPCDVSRWEADHLALVVAETKSAAYAGAAAISSDWEQLPVVADLDAALASETLVHPENGFGANTYHSYKIRKGDMAAGWAEAKVVVEATYELPHQEHAYLQPEAALSYLDDDGRITVEIAGQWAHEDRSQVAHALSLDDERVRIIYPAIGGAFGGREDISMQIVLALASMRLHERGIDRPITSTWSREESIVGHHKRHRARIHAKWGARSDGTIVAVKNTAWLDAGAYNYTSNKVLGNCHIGQAGPYEVLNAEIDSHAVYTNSTPGGAFRGFGGPQAAFAAESQMNKLAAALGMDPVEIRRRNVMREGSIGITQTVMPAGVTMPRVLEECVERATDPGRMASADTRAFSPFVSLAASEDSLRHGRGLACSFKNIGFSFGFPERCEARIVLHGEDDEPDRAVLFHAGAEVGQGAHTAFLQMAAEATGLPYDRVEGRFSDTDSSGDSGSASASRLTWMAGNSILGAAEEAEKAWRDGDRPAVGHFRFVPPQTEPLDPEDGQCVPNFSYGYVAQAVDLTVDIETGHIRVDRVVSTHDVGKAINPAMVVGQIEGGLVQAHGYVLSEHLRSEGGHIMNPRLSTYLIPGIGDIPAEVDSVVLELADPLGPWGARGMAEMPVMTYAPAVTAALHDATGVWFDTFPLTPDLVLRGLSRGDRT